MKHLLVLCLFFSCTVLVFAQEDRFSDVNQVKGKDIYIIDNSALNVAFTIIEGKVKPIKKIKNSTIALSGNIYSVENGVFSYKKVLILC